MYFALIGITCTNDELPISSVSGDINEVENNYESNYKPPVLSLSSCRELGTISCMRGAKTDYLLEIKRNISDIDPISDSQVGFIVVPSGTSLTTGSPIVESAIKDKDNIEKCQSKGEDAFIYWDKKNNPNKEKWDISISDEAYKTLTSKSYTMHIVCLQNGLTAISDTPLDLNIAANNSLLPTYENMDLEAMPAIEKQIGSDQGWFLKAKVGSSLLTDAKAGFILIKEDQAVNLYALVQKVIASENKWPTETTSFYEMTIVPAKFREEQPYIVSHLLNSQAPIQNGDFKIFAYLVKNDKHYYLSQIEHIMSNGTENSPSQEGIPPIINFTGSKHGLKVFDLKLSLEKVSGQIQNVKISENCKIEYLVDDQASPLPSGLQKALLFVEKGAIWRTSILESLFQKSATCNSNISVTEDGTICLVTDFSKPLDKSCLDFFSRPRAYQYFACLFSKEDNKLTFYTEKKELSIEEINQEINKKQPSKLQPKFDEPSIHLDNRDAYITFYHKIWVSNYAEYRLPKVNLEPSTFDNNKIIHRGFLIAKPGDLSSAKIEDHSAMVQSLINSNEEVSFDNKNNQFYILKENLTPAQKDKLQKDLYKAYENLKNNPDNALDISGWVQYNNKIIWSKPVSIAATWK